MLLLWTASKMLFCFYFQNECSQKQYIYDYIIYCRFKARGWIYRQHFISTWFFFSSSCPLYLFHVEEEECAFRVPHPAACSTFTGFYLFFSVITHVSNNKVLRFHTRPKPRGVFFSFFFLKKSSQVTVSKWLDGQWGGEKSFLLGGVFFLIISNTAPSKFERLDLFLFFNSELERLAAAAAAVILRSVWIPPQPALVLWMKTSCRLSEVGAERLRVAVRSKRTNRFCTKNDFSPPPLFPLQALRRRIRHFSRKKKSASDY